jgi:phosphonate transport system ATP-binding protein
MSSLKIRDLEKSYGPHSAKALSGITLDVGSEEMVALIGRSGAGKSTLMRCINRLVEPDSGDINLDGDDITRASRRELRKIRQTIGMIFQEFNLVNRLSVIDNVISGKAGSLSIWRCCFKLFAKEDIEQAEGLLEQVGLIDHRHKRADQLSGGQRQRVGIARALMQRPRLILADEPTASLDPQIGYEIMELITTMASKERVPVLFSMHDTALAAQFVHRIIALKDGVKIYDGAAASADLDSIYKTQPAAARSGEPQDTGTAAMHAQAVRV